MARRFPVQLHRRTWFRLFALLIALLAAAPLLQDGGLLNTRGGGDSPFLLQRLQQLVSALQDGHFPVRWMPDAAYGYGYPFFNYYAPLSIYVAAFFRLLGASYTAAIQLAQLSAFLLAAWAALELARRWLDDDWPALLASAAYTLAPFHLLNVYVRGDSLAEFWAMALYPLVLLAADRLLVPAIGAGDSQTSPRWATARMAHLALAYAMLILSHNISALIFSPFLLLYILFVAWRSPERAPRALLQAAVALAFALLLSAWFWIPALGETGLVQTDPVTAGYFHYANHFRGADLLQRSFFFDWQVAGQTAFRMGLVQALLIAAGLGALLWRSIARGHSRLGAPRAPLAFVVFALFVATFMITPLSRTLWDHVPLLPYTQFPWRFLSIQALAGALVSGALALLPARRLWSIAGIALLLLAMLPMLQVDHLPVSDADVTPQRLAQYEWFTGNIGTTVSAEYLPQTVQPRPYTSAWLNSDDRNRVQVLSGTAVASLLSRRATRQTWQVQVSSERALLEFPTLYWPGWQARLGQQRLPLSAAPGSGLIAVELPSGDHDLELRLARTPLRLAAELLSLAALLALLLGAVRPARHSAVDLWHRNRRALLLLSVLLLLAALFWRLRPAPDYEQETLSWDFAQLGYLHHAPEGIAFQDGARLARYDYSAAAAAAGETLRVDLQWSDVAADAAAGADVATLSLVTPAVHRYAYAPPLVSAQQPVQQGRARYELQVPGNAPPGLYVVRLEREGAQSLTPSGETRGALFLRPLRITSPGAVVQAARLLDARLDGISMPPLLPTLASEVGGLFDCAAGRSSPGAIVLQLAWLTAQPLAQNLTASLRLTALDGARIAQCDVQPGYGLLPSGSWEANSWLPDRLALPLPPTLPAADPYVLTVSLYDAAEQTVLTRRLGRLQWQGSELIFVPHEPQFTLPPGIEPLEARFGEAIALRGYELLQSGDRLQLTLYWEALEEGRQELTRFVHLLADEESPPLAQQDGAPQNGAYSTAQWTEGEIVADTVVLDATHLSGDDLLLAVGFYPPQNPDVRLSIVAAPGQPIADGRLLFRP